MEEYRLQFLSSRTYSGQAYQVGKLMENSRGGGHCFKSECDFSGVR